VTCGDPDPHRRAASAAARTCTLQRPLLPRSEPPGGSSADVTTALGASPQPPDGAIRRGQRPVWRLCLGPGLGMDRATQATS